MELGPTAMVDVLTGLPLDAESVVPDFLDWMIQGGLSLSDDYQRIEGLHMETMTIGLSHASGFFGGMSYGLDHYGYYLSDEEVHDIDREMPLVYDADGDGDPANDVEPNPWRVGFDLNDVNLGLAFLKPTLPLPLLPEFVAGKAHITQAGFIGAPLMMASLYDVDMTLNAGSPWFNTPYTPAIDFAGSFPAEDKVDSDGDGKIDPAGLEVPTGGAPFYMDMEDRIVQLKTAWAEMNLLNAISLSGTAAFTWGPTEKFTITNGNSRMLETLSVGVSDMSGFIGFNGPYKWDRDHDFDIDANDGVNDGGLGLQISNLTGGFTLLTSRDVLDPATYAAGRFTLASVGLVGQEAVRASASAMELAFNVGAGLSTGTAVVDFTRMAGGSYVIETGNPATAVALDYDDVYVRVAGTMEMGLTIGGAELVELQGSVDFEFDATSHQPFADFLRRQPVRGA